MLLKTSGLVIREKVLSNDNRMLTILTGEYGVIKAFIRTSRKMRSSLAAAIDLFSYSDFLIRTSTVSMERKPTGFFIICGRIWKRPAWQPIWESLPKPWSRRGNRRRNI